MTGIEGLKKNLDKVKIKLNFMALIMKIVLEFF